MRFIPLHILIVFSILGSSCKDRHPAGTPAHVARFNPDSAYLFNKLDTSGILRRLFDNPSMKGDTAIWEPNFYEKQSVQLSYDDSCHTVVDTVLYFKDEGKRPCAAYVFATYRFFVDSLDHLKIKFGSCHSCGVPVSVALFAKDSARPWELYKFEKFLTTAGVCGGACNGGVGRFSLVPIGDSWTCLLLRETPFANMGEEQGNATLYSIEENNLNGFPGSPLTPILSYMYHSSIFDVPGTPNKEENTELEVVKKKGQYYPIKLVTTTNGRQKEKYYLYSESKNGCVEAVGL